MADRFWSSSRGQGGYLGSCGPTFLCTATAWQKLDSVRSTAVVKGTMAPGPVWARNREAEPIAPGREYGFIMW